MPEPKFINLRVHTAYSLSLGATTVPALTKKLKALNVPACAITDRGNLFGGKAFSKYASDAGIKPILGSELCLHNDDSDNILLSKGREQDPDRIIILVKNENGYASLMKLFRRYYMDNTEHSDIPQINMQNLQDFHDGLICLTGGYDGPIGRLILQNRRQEAEKKLLELKDIFKDNLYIEISRVGYDEEKRTESAFIDMAYKYDIPLVATNDVYFLILTCMKRMTHSFVLLRENMLQTKIAAAIYRLIVGAAKAKCRSCSATFPKPCKTR